MIEQGEMVSYERSQREEELCKIKQRELARFHLEVRKAPLSEKVWLHREFKKKFREVRSICPDMSPFYEELDRLLREEEASVNAALAAAPIAVARQRAVGHGGFHTGALGADTPVLRWVYDCGSWRALGKAALRHNIVNYGSGFGNDEAEDKAIDLFFLSHYDADHVSGIEQLRKAARIDTIILPYLSNVDKFIVVAEAISCGRLTNSLKTLIHAPEEWAIRLGIQMMIEWPSDADEDEDGGLAAFEGEDVPPGRHIEGGAYVAVLVNAGGQLALTGVTRGFAIVTTAANASIVVKRGGQLTDWGFLPFVQKASPEARARARHRAEVLVQIDIDSPEFTSKLLDTLREPEQRRKLRRIYKDEALGDANAVSMSLYAGPIHTEGRKRAACINKNKNRDKVCTGGWLLTGDAKLRNEDRFAAWNTRYDSVLGRVDCLMIPHHGAAENWNSRLLKVAMPGTTLFVTADEGDSGKRPHEDVKAAATGWSIAIVHEEEVSTISTVSWPFEASNKVLENLSRYEKWA
jgi:hypothetical protein